MSLLKRCIDLAGSAFGLLLLAPVLAAIAVAIKLDSSGSVFFRQDRVGRNGQLFRIHKFRTMIAGAEDLGPQITAHGDSRITRIGRFLREYKLDELPQLIDVFMGDMSLVGPRPEVPRFVAAYPPLIRDKVLSLRPGITDPTAIEFVDEGYLLADVPDPETEYVSKLMPTKLARYVQYAESRSACGDLAIIFKTIVHVFRGRLRRGRT